MSCKGCKWYEPKESGWGKCKGVTPVTDKNGIGIFPLVKPEEGRCKGFEPKDTIKPAVLRGSVKKD